jgi:hypothetical protein
MRDPDCFCPDPDPTFENFNPDLSALKAKFLLKVIHAEFLLKTYPVFIN